MLPKETTNRLTFKKRERLKSQKTIQSLFIQNKNIKIYPFKLVWICEENNDSESLKMGVSVSKKMFKSAVKRNLIKRKMRECIRLNKAVITPLVKNNKITLSFMIIYLGKEIVEFDEFNSKIKQLLMRLANNLNKK